MSERSEQPVIDIDEFERRLRGPAPRPAGDPLAELARLVKSDGRKPQTLDAVFAPETGHGAGAGQAAAPDAHHAYAYAAPSAHGSAPDVYPPTGADWSADEMAEPAVEPRPRSKKLLYAAAAVIALGLGGVSTFALKARTSGPGGVVEVKAAPGPVKVQAQTAPNQSTASDASILDKGAPTQSATRVVDRQEQPMSLGDAAKAGRADAPMAVAPLPIATQNNGLPVTGEPRKVKTVSVRPDGTVVGEPKVTAQPSTTAGARSETPKSATPKAPSRVATTPNGADNDGATKTPAPRPAATTRPEPVKTAKATQTDAEDDKPAASARGGRDFAVQLAAPNNEADARAATVRLTRQYGSQLGGARVTFKKAPDKEVYRVRAAGLSQDEANAACDKVKAAGGSCFVVKN